MRARFIAYSVTRARRYDGRHRRQFGVVARYAAPALHSPMHDPTPRMAGINLLGLM
jgi:hypothetical protein